MSITSSNNSSENNLTPDELANQSACCAAVNDHLIGNLNHNNQHSNLYPLYENSNFTGANSYSPTENGLVVKKNSNSNFTTILEVPRSQSATNPVISSSVSSHVQHCANTISNGLSNNLPNGLTIGLSNGLSNGATNQLPNGLQRYTINNELNKIERYEANVYAKNGQAKLGNDHYANLLPPQYMLDKQSQFNSPNGQPPNSPMNSGPINRNSPVNQSSPFHHVAIANNIYALQQSKIDQSSNSSNNNICTLESQSSNGSRSCLTTPDSKSNERLSVLSKSQPDLSNLETELNCIDAKTGNLNMLANGQLSSVVNCNQIVGPLCTSQLEPNETELLRVENIYLRKKLEDCVQKVAKLQKFETEIQKVHQIEHMYEELMLSAEKKEKLERAARYKLEIEIKRLHQQNKQLKDQLTSALATKEEQESDLKKEDVQKTDLLFSTLLAQSKFSLTSIHYRSVNYSHKFTPKMTKSHLILRKLDKELLDLKERQEMELQAQRLTLEEQRKHIEILDSALMSTQNNVIVLESNLRKKMAYEERANNLQKALSNLQLSSERRLQMEKRARACLEKEMEMLKSQNKQADSGSTGANSNEHELERSKKLNREYEEKLLFLEAEVSKWEEKYVEENTMRQLEANAASLPKTNYDNTKAKIAALEKTYQQTALQIVEAKNERLR